MVEVKLNKSNNNPFYGLRACLTLFQNVGNNITEVMLENAYKEVKGNNLIEKNGKLQMQWKGNNPKTYTDLHGITRHFRYNPNI